MEIERKYLADPSGLSLSSYPKKELSQGYISTDPVIRIRRSDESYILTVKSDGLIARQEYEIPLSAEQYERLSDKVEGICISKTRYLIPWEEGRLTIELDLFHGALTGLVYAEVEFPSLHTAFLVSPGGNRGWSLHKCRHQPPCSFGDPRLPEEGSLRPG